MSLPQLLLVDDSESVLAFERAALSSHYAIATACNGREALEKLAAVKPEAMLLDLSMPELDGDEVLARMQLDPALSGIPVIIVSSETARAEACVKAGAKAYLPKPLRAADLLPLIERILAQARAERRRGSLAVLLVAAGGQQLALPLECVQRVLHQVATRPLPFGPSYLSEVVQVHGEAVVVLDLARRLGLAHGAPVEERKLVVVMAAGALLALCVDEVRDPEELDAAQLTPRDRLGANHGPLRDALVGVARVASGPVPILDPRALVSPQLLAQAAAALRNGGAA